MIKEPIPFLANIVIVSHADGKLSASELGQLEAIRAEFKFRKSDFNAAIKLVEQGNHKMTPIGAFADQVKNLELMLRVAYADDDIDKTEASLLVTFCKACGIYRDQLEKIRGEVLSTLEHKEKICLSCNATADSAARFCPKCGNSLDAATTDIQLNIEIPRIGIAIEFAESTAASFTKALELAKTTQGFQSCQKNKKSWYLATYPSGNIKEALPLVEALSGIRNRILYLNGKEQVWDEVFGFAWCAEQRDTAYRPIEYCFGKDNNCLNLWGCKQARMDWTDWAKWFTYGRWEKAGILSGKYQWHFDKGKIRHELTTNLFRYRFCPYLKTELAEAALKHLPDIVTPESDPIWGYHQNYEQVPGAIKIVEKERSESYTFTSEYWADGVKPNGLKLFAEILNKSFKDLGNKPITLDRLLS